MEEIKVSEMLQAESINKDDSVMIIQEGVNKKAGGSIQTATGTSLSIPSVADTCKVKSNSKNLVNPDTLLIGYQIDGAGTIAVNSSRAVTDYIEVKPETSYVVSGCTPKVTVFYDNTKTLISTITNATTYTTPANTKYIRYGIDITADYSQMQLEEGSSATSYNPYNTTAIINPFEMEIGGMSAGEPVERTDRIRSKQFIEVYPNTMYTIKNAIGKNANVYYYDAEQTYIGQYSTSVVATPYSITTPNNCKYIKVMYNYASGDFINSIIIGITQILSLTPQGEKSAFTYDSLTNVISDGSVAIEYNTQNRLLNNNDTLAIKEYVDREIDNRKSSYVSYSGTTSTLQTITGTTPTTITNMSVNIKTTGKPLFVATSFFAKASNASYSALAKVYVDGVEKVGRLNTIISTSDIPYTGMVLLDNIPAGNHTIEIKIAGENANSNITLPTWYTRYLNVWEIN